MQAYVYELRPPKHWWIALLLICIVTSSSWSSAASTQWDERYDEARTALIEDRHGEAATMFDELARTAENAEDRRLASEFAAIARERLARIPPPQPDLRTTDELSLLYTSAFVYGFGTSAWVALHTKPDNVAGAVLPYLALTTAAVGGVAVADDYKPFRLGVPQSISAGMLLGLGESVWLLGYQRARAQRRGEPTWSAPTVATVAWSGATVGAVSGGLISGFFRQTTPGRVSFTTSGALWGGLLASFSGAAIESRDSHRKETAFASGGIGYSAGLLASLVVAPTFRPSIARVRFVDLGGLGGGLLSAAGYFLVVGEDGNSRGGLTAAAIGSTAALGLSWWATDDIPAEELDIELADRSDFSWSPMVTPVPGGLVGGVRGAL